jgi:hypothetical protein
LYLGPGHRYLQEKPFKTAFVRPDRFRFEYTETAPDGLRKRYIVWRSGSRVQSWWDIAPGIEEPESLGLALAGATGVSGSSAHTIPALLLPREVTGRRLTDMTDIKRIADAPLRGVDCFRLEGRFAKLPRTVWVDRKTLVIRRIDWEYTSPTSHWKQMTTYEPKINEGVAQEFLEFDREKK